jgi:hypothetical protein
LKITEVAQIFGQLFEWLMATFWVIFIYSFIVPFENTAIACARSCWSSRLTGWWTRKE